MKNITNKMYSSMSCFKSINEKEMTFECYGNTKNVVDHANDLVVDGAYSKSIKKHKENKTMPKMFFGHESYSLPVGVWLEMEEDAKGLKMKGKFSETQKGIELYKLAKDGAIDSFSIGYRIIDESYDNERDIFLLKDIDIREVSIVNFPCNEESTLQDIKSLITNEQLSKRDLELFLRRSGLSRKEAKTAISFSQQKTEKDIDIFKQMSDL